MSEELDWCEVNASLALLKNNGFVDDYKITKGGVMLRPNPWKTLMMLLAHPVVVVRKELIPFIKKHNRVAACTLLYYAWKSQSLYDPTSRESPKITITAEQLPYIESVFGLLLKSKPTVIGDVAIYHANIPTTMENVFDDNLHKVICKIRFPTPISTDTDNYNLIKATYTSRPLLFVHDLASACGVSEVEMRRNLWNLARKGLLSFDDIKSITGIPI